MKDILVGVDGSSRQQAVLATAIRLAQALGGSLTLMRAVALPLGLPSRAYAVRPDELGDLLLEEARKDLSALAAQVPAPLLREARAELGIPWRTLVDVADRQHAELLVIGSHGYGPLDRVLGTTAAKVVDHAKCSVLVVRSAG